VVPVVSEQCEHERRPALIYSEHLEGPDREAMYRQACAMGLEGIVWKRLTSRYVSGRCQSWVKVLNPNYSPAVGEAADGLSRCSGST
jgi:ATP-dependent DNA ligase